MRIPVFSIVGLSLILSPARADFALMSPDAPPAVASAAAVAAPGTTPEAQSPKSAPVHRPVKNQKSSRAHKLIYANGFGSKIPLDFAVKQIVPSRIKVAFGAGADKTALVDWRGGRRWRAVLRDAVRPLGLRVSVHKNSVSIER